MSGWQPARKFASRSRSTRRPATAAAHTVVATLPGRDRSKYVLFCAHGDSDSGGPGANDNASGVAIVLEIARAAAAAIKSGAMPQPAWDLRFASWGGEIASTREYLAAMDKDPCRLQAVFNYDQSGFGSSKDALYVEPDDVPVNSPLITLVRAVMKDHIGARGFPEHAASIKTQGGTDSYVFQNTRTPGATLYPAVTLYTSAWDRERAQPVTEGFPPNQLVCRGEAGDGDGGRRRLLPLGGGHARQHHRYRTVQHGMVRAGRAAELPAPDEQLNDPGCHSCQISSDHSGKEAS